MCSDSIWDDTGEGYSINHYSTLISNEFSHVNRMKRMTVEMKNPSLDIEQKKGHKMLIVEQDFHENMSGP